ncbi:MAG: ABC transporter substrate-binding protein [Clostridiales Family XIII bacterium]|jgi:branched-chain amino acid transport system substrate-binding protein|nr:ABC transporter substrate-binding protein [Clostridiales Family XIII bacterium]
MKKRFSVALAVVLTLALSLALFSTGCTKKADDPGTSDSGGDVIKIGVYQPLTGANAAGGELELAGVKLANEAYPEVLGKKIELVVVDNKSDKAEAANAASRLIEKDGVCAVIGSYASALAIAAGEVMKSNEVPAVGVSNTNVQVTKGNDFYFRACSLDPYQGTVMARYAFNTLGAKSAAIIKNNADDYSVGLANFFKEEFLKLGGTIVSETEYLNDTQDFNAQMTEIKSKNPEVVFSPALIDSLALIVKQARENGVTVPILGGDTYENPDFLTLAGESANGCVFSTFFDAEGASTEEATKFLAAYEAKTPGESPSAATALGWDAYLMIYKAIEKAGSADSIAIRDQLVLTDFDGVTGKTVLNEDGDAVTKDWVIKEVKDGAFSYLATVSPA